MTRQERMLGALGATSGLIGFAAGALGAHALKSLMSPYFQGVFEIAVRYQLVHALAILVIVGLPKLSTSLSLKVAWIFVIGTVIFSGSLYYYALTGTRLIAMATPFGGLVLMSGWLVLVLSFLRSEVKGA